MVLLDLYMLMAGLAVAGAGFVFGGVFAFVARRTKPEIIAISLETAMQNGNVAFVLLRLSLPSPYSDMAGMTPIAQMFMTSAILFPLYFIHLIVKCCKRGKKEKKGNKEHSKMDQEAARALMMDSHQRKSQEESPPINYHGGQVTPEYSWTQNPNFIVPNSPTKRST